MTKQAKAGGELGANGEWYEGGKFLNTVPENSKVEGSRKKDVKPRKVQIAPYVWVVSDQTPIFCMVGAQAEYINRYDAVKGIRPSAAGCAYYGNTFHGVDVAELCERYNAGERFM